jgi:hypothetical protein
MGNTLSNCIPQFPAQTTPPPAEVVDEYAEEHDKSQLSPSSIQQGSQDIEPRGLKLQKAVVASPAMQDSHTIPNLVVESSSTSSVNNKANSSAKVIEQDFFSDMKPKYAPPPIVNPKHVSRLTMEEDTASAHYGWDTMDDTDRTSDPTPKPKDPTRQKFKLDSTTTTESFEDFDD